MYTLSELNDLNYLDVDGLVSLYIAELGGEPFYNALADRIANDEAKRLLRRSGREETGHTRRLGRAITIKQGRDFEPTPKMLQRSPVELPDNITGDLLQSLVQKELDGDAGYQHWADNEHDAEVARLLRLNGREESIHSQRLQQAVALIGSADQ